MTELQTKKRSSSAARLGSVAAALLCGLLPQIASAGIDGITVAGSVHLTADDDYVLLPDGAAVYTWGYHADDRSVMQYPGPTLIVTQGQPITVTLTNDLPAAAGNVSIVFPGQAVTATGGVQGAITQEAAHGGTVTYSFTPTTPGTYQYHSGTRPDLQVEMGLVGALIVRPSAPVPVSCTDTVTGTPAAGWGYANDGACFDREYLFMAMEMDLDVHRMAEEQRYGAGPIQLGDLPYHSEYWLFNGRAAPDVFTAAGDAQLPNQPYNCLPTMYPGERVLARVVGAGRQMHPFHTHGNHTRVLARDGRLITAANGTTLAGPTLFTIPIEPGRTVDTIFTWTGAELGWDMYGHAAGDPLAAHEYAPDHGKEIPVVLPDNNVLTFGGFWSGSPYLGALGTLPPGEGGLNPSAGFSYMWHSHTERELVNNDVFPGGMMTMMIIEPRP